MNRIFRSFIVPALAALGALALMPSIAHADERRPEHASHDRDRLERERIERERIERERRERERLERERREREREHQLVCARAYDSGAPAWRLREMGCWVR